MNKPTHLSLFTGIGGLDLAAAAAGFQTVGQCEWADYPNKVLEKHWPHVDRWRDIKTLTGASFYERTGLSTVDIISGGFPCQPFSVAGKRKGKKDDRYLWPEMLRVISELRPTWVIGENVPGIVSMALDQVISDLEDKNYETITFNIPACGVDAPHKRARIFIIAHSIPDATSKKLSDGGSTQVANPEEEPQPERCHCLHEWAQAIPHPDGTRCATRGRKEQTGRQVIGGQPINTDTYSPRCQKHHLTPEPEGEKFHTGTPFTDDVSNAGSYRDGPLRGDGDCKRKIKPTL